MLMTSIYNFATNKKIIELRIKALMVQMNRCDRAISIHNNKISKLAQRKADLQRQIDELEKALNGINNPNPGNSSFGQMVLTVHNAMMDYFKNKYGDATNFVIPFIPRNYNLKLDMSPPNAPHNGFEDYKICNFPRLGIFIGDTTTFVEVFGYFTKDTAGRLIDRTTNAAAIVSNTVYVVQRLRFPPDSLGGQLVTVEIAGNLDRLKETQFNSSFNVIKQVADHLTRWARNTAFLCTPILCENYYDNRYNDGIMPPGEIVYSRDRWNSAVPAIPAASTKDSKIILPNSLQREYYDRLYEFMQAKGFIETNSAEQVISLLCNFSPSFTGTPTQPLPSITITSQPTTKPYPVDVGNIFLSVSANVKNTNISNPVEITQNSPAFDWQVSLNNGITWQSVVGRISSVTKRECHSPFTNNTISCSSLLTINNVTAANNGQLYRCVVSAKGAATKIISNVVNLEIDSPIVITKQPVDIIFNGTGNLPSFEVDGTGQSVIIWERSTDGKLFTPIGGQTNKKITISLVTTSDDGTFYRAKFIKNHATKSEVVVYSKVVKLSVKTWRWSGNNNNLQILTPPGDGIPGIAFNYSASVPPINSPSALPNFTTISGTNSEVKYGSMIDENLEWTVRCISGSNAGSSFVVSGNSRYLDLRNTAFSIWRISTPPNSGFAFEVRLKLTAKGLDTFNSSGATLTLQGNTWNTIEY